MRFGLAHQLLTRPQMPAVGYGNQGEGSCQRSGCKAGRRSVRRMDSDVLFPVRNNFFLGAYQSAIAEAADLDTLDEAQKVERDVYVYRAYIELGSFDLVINEVTPTSPQALQAVKLLAQLSGGKVPKEEITATVQQWLEDAAVNSNATVLLIAGIIFARNGQHVEALRACHSVQTLETLAVSIQVCLQLARVDQAEKYLKAMTALDEDATLTQLAVAWVNLELGGAKVQEAFFIYQELGERYNWTVRLYNGSAACLMRMESWAEAERRLQEAYAKDAKNAETIANLITVGLHLGRNVSRHVNQLKTAAPQHPAVRQSAWAEEQFDRACSAVVAA